MRVQKVKEGDIVSVGDEVYVFGPTSTQAYNVLVQLVERGVNPEKVDAEIHLNSVGRGEGRVFSFLELAKLLAR